MNALWTREAAKRYLNDFPLPETFRWPHTDGGERPVQPVHLAVTGYGKWLAETPAFPGLFELVVDVLNDTALTADPGDGEWLAAELNSLRAKHGKNLPGMPGKPLAHRLRPMVGAPLQLSLFGLN